jgi:hypothetical protein
MRPIALVSIAAVIALFVACGADMPQTMSYQGVLRDASGNVVPNGSYSLTFRMYLASAGGGAIWQETQSVSVSDGLVNVTLGTVAPLALDFDVPYWLGVSVGGGAELTPRVRLTPAPYAHYAAVANEVVGGSGDSDWVESGSDIYRLTGNVGIGLTTPQKRLHVREQVDGGVSFGMKLDNPSGVAGTATGLLFKVDGGTEDRGKGAIVYERTATWNRGSLHFLQNNAGNMNLPTLADAAMTIANNRNVGIGVTDPKTKLEVGSHVRITNYSWPATGRGLELAYNDEQNKGYVFAYDRDLSEFGSLALGFGNVGVGTNYPAEMLHVDGVIYSSSGGIKFPDGTLQTTAGGGGGGGLVLPYAGTASTTAAAFAATNTNTSGKGVEGRHSPSGNYGYVGTNYAGVLGYHEPSDCYGYVGGDGVGVKGFGSGSGHGVVGEAYLGYGVRGYANGVSTVGVYGEVPQSTSDAVRGVNTAASTTGKLGTNFAGVYGSGASYGVHGVSWVGGYALYGENSQGTAVYGVTTTGSAIKGYCSTGGYAGDFQGNVRIRSIGTGDTIIEFGEGLDYAEGFDVSGADAARPGDVLVIDPDHPGELAVSRHSYDTRVAGIAAGANGLGSAVRLGGDRFDLDVALAGRVYCNVDATEDGVEPGDLLTTSGTPGHAMRVSDPGRAHGAILGKAMERLEKGRRGQILVLVALQ